MAFTVTATESGASASHGVALQVRVLTNATESGGATSGSTSNAAGAIAQGSLTPNFSSSYVAFSVSADNVTSMPGAATNNTYDFTNGNPSSVWSTAQGHWTGTVTAGTPLTYGAGSGTSVDHANWCAYEIPASGGTITLDGSSPAGVLSGSGLQTGLAATTASFTPPVGSVLVAEVCAGGTGSGAGITMAITDTSGLGLIWSLRAVSSASDNFQPTWVYTATVPAVFTGISTTGRQAMPGRVWRRRFHEVQHPPEIAPVPPPPVYPPSLQAQPGQTWKTHYRLPQRPKPTAPVNPPCIIGQSGTGLNAYFTDRFGTPRLYLGGETWGLPANAGRWNGGDWRADYDFYHATRRGQGFTANVTHPFGHTHTGCNNDLGHTWDGLFPFEVNGSDADLTGQGGTVTLNVPFWQRIDYMFQSAAVMGITVFLDLSMSLDMPTGASHGFTNGVFQNASTAQIQTASQRVAERYALTENLVWFFGDDYFGGDDTNYNAMWTGINAADPRVASCTSVENWPSGSTARYLLDLPPGSETPFPFGNARATYNFAYTYQQIYFGIEYAYTEPSPIGPVIWGDGMFWGNGGTSAQNDQLQRNHTWWALASGARGFVAEDETVLQWDSTAATVITTNGSFKTWTRNIYNLFSGLNGWWKLIPDTGSALVTAGRGTRATYTSAQYLANTDNYVAASVTPDGSLAVIYCAQAMSITIDETKLGTGYTATWADPASGALTGTAAGSTYSSSGLGNNSAGGADWVLILAGPALTSATGTAAIAGAGAVTAKATQAVTATAAGAGAVAATVTQACTASLAGAGSVTANASVITAGSTAALAGAGAVTAVVTQAVIASPAGAGSVAAVVTQTATATLAGAGAVTAKVTQAVTASPAGAGAVTATVTEAVTATLAGAGSVTGVVTQAVIASLTGAGALTANPAGAGSTASLAGAGAVTAVATVAATATAAGAGTVAATVTQRGSAALSGAGALTAAGQITGTANLTGAGTLSAKATQAATAQAAGAGALTALAAQGATAALTGAGAITAISGTQLAFTVGQLSAATAAGSTLTAATAPLAVLTASDQRTGGSGG